jgi:hypothetical protein
MKSTLRQIGGEYQSVHLFLDEYFGHFRSNLHWAILHHQLGIEMLVERYGEEVRRPAEIHIADDMGFVPEGPTDPRLLELLTFLGPRDLEYADEILEELYGKNFDLEAAFD